MPIFFEFPFVLSFVIIAEQPIDKIPAERTPGEQVLQQHSKTAKSLLGDFNLNEAGKMVQKRRPAASILDEELLLSEDEPDNPPAAKKPAIDSEAKEVKSSPANNADKQQQDKSNVNKALKMPQQHQQQQQQGGNLLKRKKMMNRSPSNNRSLNSGSMLMNMNNLNQQMPDTMARDASDLFMRKRNFLDSDMGFDRPNDRFNMGGGGGNFIDRNPNNSMNSNNFGNNRDFADDFSRRPAKNDGFNNFGKLHTIYLTF